MGEDVSDWLIFGREIQPDSTAEVTEVFDESLGSIDDTIPFNGLHWENATQINQPPVNKMEHTHTNVKDGYHHLFSSPTDSMFALLPYSFWELMAYEINQYATQYMANKQKIYYWMKNTGCMG